MQNKGGWGQLRLTPQNPNLLLAASYVFFEEETMGRLASQLGFQVGWLVKKPSTNPI